MVPSNALEIVVITSDLISIVHLRAELVVESGGWREVLELDCDAAFPFPLLPEPMLPLACFCHQHTLVVNKQSMNIPSLWKERLEQKHHVLTEWEEG